jgi:hypothetical protein
MRPVPPWLEGENNKLQHGDLSANQQGRAGGASRRTRISRWLCILLTDLLEGQEATVLQLPAQPKTPAEEAAQRRVVYADMTTDGMVRHPSSKGLDRRVKTEPCRIDRVELSTKREHMADDLTNKGPQDRSRISLLEPHEVQYWADKFNVSKERLSEAVRNVGHSAAAVEKELKRLA